MFTVGQYNLVSMALNTLGVQPEPGLARLPAVVSGRLAGKVALVIGAGQTPGDTIGNGRATAVLFAREGARVVAVDRRLEAAEETVAQIRERGRRRARRLRPTPRARPTCAALVADCVRRYGRIDVLHNNVGIGGGDAGPAHVEEADWDRILAVNLKSVMLPVQARAARDARAAERLDRQRLVDRGGVRDAASSPTRPRRPASTRTRSRSRSATRSTASAPTSSCRA